MKTVAFTLLLVFGTVLTRAKPLDSLAYYKEKVKKLEQKLKDEYASHYSHDKKEAALAVEAKKKDVIGKMEKQRARILISGLSSFVILLSFFALYGFIKKRKKNAPRSFPKRFS